MITQEQFNKMMNEYMRQLASEPATWEKEAMTWAQGKGLLQGDESGNAMPKKFLTRGEIATILQRYDQGK